jgi:hypothetical protein
MWRRFSVLKRGALSRAFVGKLKITVNLFTQIVAGLTAPESAILLFNKKAKWFGEFERVAEVFQKVETLEPLGLISVGAIF